MDLWKGNLQSPKLPFTLYEHSLKQFFTTRNNHSFMQERPDYKTDLPSFGFLTNNALIDFLHSDAMKSFYPVQTWNESFPLMNNNIREYFMSGVLNSFFDFTRKFAEILDHNMGEISVSLVSGKLDMIAPWEVILKL